MKNSLFFLNKTFEQSFQTATSAVLFGIIQNLIISFGKSVINLNSAIILLFHFHSTRACILRTPIQIRFSSVNYQQYLAAFSGPLTK